MELRRGYPRLGHQCRLLPAWGWPLTRHGRARRSKRQQAGRQQDYFARCPWARELLHLPPTEASTRGWHGRGKCDFAS